MHKQATRAAQKTKQPKQAVRKIATKSIKKNKTKSQLTHAKRTMSSGKVQRVPNWINGKEVQSEATTWFPIISPSTGELIAEVPQSTPAELNAATAAAEAAQKQWRLIPASVRQRHISKLISLINENEMEIAQ